MIRTERLTIRRICEDDWKAVQAVWQMRQDPLMRSMTGQMIRMISLCITGSENGPLIMTAMNTFFRLSACGMV